MLNISFYDGVAEVDISDYVVSNEWELLDQPGQRPRSAPKFHATSFLVASSCA